MNTPGRHYFFIIKYFQVNDNDIKQAIVYNVTDLSFQEQLSWSLFICVEVLRPGQPNGVMSSPVSLPNHTFTGQA